MKITLSVFPQTGVAAPGISDSLNIYLLTWVLHLGCKIESLPAVARVARLDRLVKRMTRCTHVVVHKQRKEESYDHRHCCRPAI